MKEKTEMMERLIRNINHEIKNPLTVIRGYAQLLTMKAADEEFQKKTGRLIMENVDIVDDRISAMYRAFSQTPADHSTSNIVEEIHRIVQSFGDEFKKRVEISCEHAIDAEVNSTDFGRIIECLVLGFNWKGNEQAHIRIEIGLRDGRPALEFNYQNADFSNFNTDWFYLPFSEKTNFKGGTEIFEVFCLAEKNGWDFKLLRESNNNGFIVIL